MKAPPFALPASPADARALQEALRGRVVRRGRPAGPVVAGFDVSENSDRARAAIVVWRDGEVLEEAAVETRVRFPYVPGLLSFREIPPLIEAWARIRTRPDAGIVDGQGLAHPRRFGLACHLGVLLDLPVAGCAKSRLVGEHDGPGPARGDRAPLVDRGEIVGAVLRTRAGCRPVYVSVGHRLSLGAAVSLVLGAATRFRLPEPQRLADRLSKAARIC